MPAVEEKLKKVKDLGLDADPAQFPELRATDPEVAGLFDQSLQENPDLIDDIPHP